MPVQMQESLLVAVVGDLSTALPSRANCTGGQQIMPVILQRLTPVTLLKGANVRLCTNIFRLRPRKAKIYILK